ADIIKDGYTDFWEGDGTDNATGKRCKAWMADYQKFYHSPEFEALVFSHSAHPFVGLTSFAARPPKRDGKPQGVEDFRAIGFGAALNVSGSCASLFMGASKFLHADNVLSDKESIEPLVKLYLRDPKTQDAINRATFGIAMADLDSAWKYVGKE